MNYQLMEKSRTFKLTLCALFVALTAIGAFIKIPAPLAPFSLQVLFVIMAGIILGPRLGFLSQLAYIFIGLAGIPIFAQGGGPSYVFQPSFGFLLGFAAAAFVIGTITEGVKHLTFPKLLAASTAGLATIYAIGLPYLYMIVNFYLGKDMPVFDVLWGACLIFLPGDLLKIVLASILSLKILKAIKIR
jgi:biotin transport system substrate-specific component